MQVIKKDAKKGGVLQFGTEVVAAADGSIAGLLGRRPGRRPPFRSCSGWSRSASPTSMDAWRPKLVAMVPSYGKQLSDNAELAKVTMTATAAELQIAQ